MLMLAFAIALSFSVNDRSVMREEATPAVRDGCVAQTTDEGPFAMTTIGCKHARCGCGNPRGTVTLLWRFQRGPGLDHGPKREMSRKPWRCPRAGCSERSAGSANWCVHTGRVPNARIWVTTTRAN